MEYIITTEEPDDKYSTGVVLSVEEAPNRVDALNQWARKVIDDDFLKLAAENNISAESRINLALWLIEGVSLEEGERIVIYTLATDAEGNTDKMVANDIEFIKEDREFFQHDSN